MSFENIPTELKNRDQWLMWDASADTPRRPHWRGNFGVSWTNPDDWHSYEETVEAASERESWGIGYVFAKGNEDFPRGVYGALDLDGCVETGGEHRRPKDWLPSLEPFIDRGAYIEFSPSGGGIHIPVFGFEPPEWWSDVALDEHEGVEAYDKKFFTFTGDRLPGSGENVADNDEYVEEWLKEAYEAIRGERPWEAQEEEPREYSGPTTTGATDDVDEILRAIDALDARDVADRTIVHAWNDDAGTSGDNRAFYPTWGPNSNGTANICDRDGWTDTGTDSGSGGPVIMAAIDAGVVSHSGVARGDVTGSEWWDAVDHLRELGFPIPEKERPTRTESDGSTEVVDEETGESRRLPLPTAFSVNGGHYGQWKQTDDGKEYFDIWTNFQIEVLSFVFDMQGNPLLNLRVWPATAEDEYDVTVEPTVFNEKRDFKSHICTGLTTTFSGGEDELNAIKMFVGEQDAPNRTGTQHMGLHGEEWVTPHGSLTAEEWAEEPEMVYMERDIGVERKWTLHPDEDDDVDSDTVRDILELLPQTRAKERFIPTLAWFYASPLRPFIHDWTGQFNIHGVLGETGCGKTATLSTLWQLFGMEGEPLTVDDTKFVLTATLGSTNSIPMWFDEYKPSDMKDYEVDRFWNLVRKVTRGGVASRGNADKSTEEYHLHAPTVVSGEERVSGSAEERRGVFTTFRKDVTDAGSDSARAFTKLNGGRWKGGDGSVEYYDGYDLSQHALAFYRFVLGLDEDDLREHWRKSGESVAELLSARDIDNLEDLVEQGLQTIKFGAGIYRMFAAEMGADPEALSKAAVDDAIIYVATQSIGGVNRKSHLDAFFEVFARAAKHGYLEEGEHYAIVRDGQPSEELRINLPTAFDKVTRYARDHDVPEDLLNSCDDYRERIKDNLENDGYLVNYSQPTTGIGRCIGLHMETAGETLDNFEKSMLVNVAIEGDELVAAGLRDLNPGYADVTAVVNRLDTDIPDNGPDFSAVLEDRTGVVDAVCWADEGFLDTLEEGQAYLLRSASVGFDQDGATQVEFTPGVTEVQEIERGVGTVPAPNVDEGQGQLDAAADGGVATTDEFDELRPKVVDELQRASGAISLTRLAGALSEEKERIETTVKRLSRTGTVILDGDSVQLN